MLPLNWKFLCGFISRKSEARDGRTDKTETQTDELTGD